MIYLMSFMGALIVWSFAAHAADLSYQLSRGDADTIQALQPKPLSRQPTDDTELSPVTTRFTTGGDPFDIDSEKVEGAMRRFTKNARQSYFSLGKVLFSRMIDEQDVRLQERWIGSPDDGGALHKRSFYTFDDFALHEAIQQGNFTAFNVAMSVIIAKPIIAVRQQRFLDSVLYKKLDQYITILHNTALIASETLNTQPDNANRQRRVTHELDETFNNLVVHFQSSVGWKPASNFDLLQLFLTARVPIDTWKHASSLDQLQDEKGNTMLHMALNTSSIGAAWWLIKNGASVVGTSGFITPLQQLQNQVKNLKSIVRKIRDQSIYFFTGYYMHDSTSPRSRAVAIRKAKDEEVRRQHQLDSTLKQLKTIEQLHGAPAKGEPAKSEPADGDRAKGDRDKKIKDCIQLLQDLGVEFKLDLKK